MKNTNTKNDLLLFLLSYADLWNNKSNYTRFLFTPTKLLLAIMINPKNYDLIKNIILCKINHIDSDDYNVNLSEDTTDYYQTNQVLIENDLNTLSYYGCFIKHRRLFVEIIHSSMRYDLSTEAKVFDEFRKLSIEVLKEEYLQEPFIKFHKRATKNIISYQASLKNYSKEIFAEDLYRYLRREIHLIQQFI